MKMVNWFAFDLRKQVTLDRAASTLGAQRSLRFFQLQVGDSATAGWTFVTFVDDS